jgi:guanylate kinase
VVAAPSGTGKTTVCRAALQRDSRLRFSVSHTTRKPRDGERDGVDYHFVSTEGFVELVKADAFVEYAEYGDNLYGTSWAALEEPLASGWDLIVEIEVKGAAQFRERRRDACFIFLLPPDMDALGDRLRGRGTDSEETISKRLAIAEQELLAIEFFDYAVVNRDVEQAVVDVLEIIHAERSGRTRGARERHGRARVFKNWRGAADD